MCDIYYTQLPKIAAPIASVDTAEKGPDMALIAVVIIVLVVLFAATVAFFLYRYVVIMKNILLIYIFSCREAVLYMYMYRT